MPGASRQTLPPQRVGHLLGRGDGGGAKSRGDTSLGDRQILCFCTFWYTWYTWYIWYILYILVMFCLGARPVPGAPTPRPHHSGRQEEQGGRGEKSWGQSGKDLCVETLGGRVCEN